MSGVVAQFDLLRCCYVVVPLLFYLPLVLYRVYVLFLIVEPFQDLRFAVVGVSIIMA